MYEIDRDRKRPISLALFHVTAYDLSDKVLAKFEVASVDKRAAEEVARDEIVHNPYLRSSLGRVSATLALKDDYPIQVLIRRK